MDFQWSNGSVWNVVGDLGGGGVMEDLVHSIFRDCSHNIVPQYFHQNTL